MRQAAKILLLIAVLVLVFSAGAYLMQATAKPQVVVEAVVEYKAIEIERIVETKVETVVIQPVRHFESLNELESWLSGVIIVSWGDCDDYALIMQELALSQGYIISFEVIYPDEYNPLFETQLDKPHAMNLAVIGNEIYYIEPQTMEIVLRGYLD